MNSANDTLTRVKISSAKSPRIGACASKWIELPREETQERFSQALDNAAEEVFEMMVGKPLGSLGQATLPRVVDYTAMIGFRSTLPDIKLTPVKVDSAGPYVWWGNLGKPHLGNTSPWSWPSRVTMQSDVGESST